jgi:hypothetical protein
MARWLVHSTNLASNEPLKDEINYSIAYTAVNKLHTGGFTDIVVLSE